MSIGDLPTLNASLNALSFALLILGYGFIRQGNREAHRNCMLAAFGVSCLFLLSYLVYHYNAGSVPYPGTGWLRVFYLTILITHIPLAVLVPVLALVTLVRGLRDRLDKHVAIARWTLPIWMYVSLTGVIIYAMLYLFPA
ncbi:MAG: DUF420 domain-containing protein [Acidobacteriota bacterium]|nr:DUF420 domain-containing protein [Acidobacteriota bacterium]